MSVLPEPVECVCVVKLGTLERNGEGGGVSVTLRMLIILLLGSVLGEGGDWGKLDLVSSSINSSFTQNEVFGVCTLF